MEWLGDHLWAAWLGIAAVLLISELASLDLVLLMLAIGAFGGAVTAVLTDAWEIQIVVAVVIAVGLLAVVRPGIVRRLQTGPDLLIGPERMIGVQAQTFVALSAEEPGQVKIDGELWTARPADGAAPIKPGQTVVVTAINGATAIVAPVA
ncbi:NfeD family protein [Nocardioides sp. Kera G14]|uniref:NfeD family protein n=1 Tax=Nocardioides sp. Kera G14 TaxID=2884264 RepID=UPI001D10F33E|nr:NfeD family protein [Nocardioides sp. Kera G14]UDY25142.1 NfeD family protein [Nocardioides sp. Kera G14]